MRLFDFVKNIFESVLPSLKKERLVLYDIAFLIFLFGFVGVILIVFDLVWLSFSFAIILIILSLITGNKRNRTICFIILFSLVSAGSYVYLISTNNKNDFLVGETVRHEGIISDFPRYSLSYDQIEVKTERGVVSCLIDQKDTFHIGDKVMVEGVVSYLRGDKAYLNRQKIVFLSSSDNKIIVSIELLRNRLLDNIKMTLPANESSLAAGLLLGDTSGFSKEFKNDLRETGTSHIVALSGWNVMILITVSLSLFGMIFKRYVALILSVIFIVLLFFLAGYSASLLRAVIMGMIFILASFFGKKYSLRNSIVFSALMMSLWNPMVIIDLGFQLSYMAILGLVYLSPIITKIMNKVSVGRGLNVLGFPETLSAQIFVSPVILLNGINPSLISPIANISIGFLIPITFFFSFLTSILGDGYGIISWTVSFIANNLLSYEIWIINFIAHIF